MRHALNGTHFSAAGSRFAVLHSECIRDQLRVKIATGSEFWDGANDAFASSSSTSRVAQVQGEDVCQLGTRCPAKGASLSKFTLFAPLRRC